MIAISAPTLKPLESPIWPLVLILWKHIHRIPTLLTGNGIKNKSLQSIFSMTKISYAGKLIHIYAYEKYMKKLQSRRIRCNNIYTVAVIASSFLRWNTSFLLVWVLTIKIYRINTKLVTKLLQGCNHSNRKRTWSWPWIFRNLSACCYAAWCAI